MSDYERLKADVLAFHAMLKAVIELRNMLKAEEPYSTTIDICWARESLDRILESDEPAPVPMVLHCPACGTQYIDGPDPAIGWTDPPHKSHLCHGCGVVWRPAAIATTGVQSVGRGSRDTWAPEPPEAKP